MDKLAVGNRVEVRWLDHCSFERETGDGITNFRPIENRSVGIVCRVEPGFLLLAQSTTPTDETDGICILRNCIVDISVLRPK